MIGFSLTGPKGETQSALQERIVYKSTKNYLQKYKNERVIYKSTKICTKGQGQNVRHCLDSMKELSTKVQKYGLVPSLCTGNSFHHLFFNDFFYLNSEANNPEGKIRGIILIVLCKSGTKMVDISKNESCVPRIFPIMIFQHP